MKIEEKFKNEDVIVFLKNKFHFRGKILEINDNFLILDDYKEGEMILSFSEISQIKKVNGLEKNEKKED